MIETSQVYKEEIKDLYNRKIYGRVQIDYTDPELDQSVEVLTHDNNYTSYPNQIVNGKDNASFKYICLDGSWKLGDKTSCLAPTKREVEDRGYQFGLWGGLISNPYGVFDEDIPIIDIEFIARPFTSLKLVGDSKRGEYPKYFEIRLFKQNGELAHLEEVFNDSVYWEKEIETVTDIVKMQIKIEQWSKPFTVVKINEVFSSIRETYEGEDIMSINLIEEKETSQGSLPVGNISSNEIEIKLNNENREFDAGNSKSDLYGLIKPNRRIKAWIGTKSQLVPLGTFWTKDWDVPEDDVIAKTIGRDRLDRLRDNEYSTSKVEVNKTIHQIAEIILEDAGLNSSQYWLDDELKEYTIPYAYFKPITHREALRQLATACLGQVYCDRQGVIRFEGPSFTLNRVDEIKTLAFLQAEFPAESEVIDSYGIAGDDYFSKDNPSKQSDIANHITVETQPLKIDEEQEIYSSNESMNIKANEKKIVTIQFNKVPCMNVVINTTGVGEILESKIYSWGAEVTVNSDIDGEFNIIASGKPLKIANKDNIVLKEEESIIENGIIRYKMPSNHLIQNRSIAEVIADRLLTYYKDPKRDLKMDWRGNPALELGDVITVNDYPRGEVREKGYYYITKQELEFSGYLRAKLEGRRAL